MFSFFYVILNHFLVCLLITATATATATVCEKATEVNKNNHFYRMHRCVGPKIHDDEFAWLIDNLKDRAITVWAT